VKPQADIYDHNSWRLGVEVYGGALLNPWFDRDLSLAGRVHFKDSAGQRSAAIVDFKCPIATIPSLAIHLDREANKNRSINP
ncbi:MAG: M18 family aminopeptidase, partial [Pseudomonadales bacterium]